MVFTDLLRKWQHNTDQCTNFRVIASIVSQGSEKYVMDYELFSRNSDWDMTVKSDLYGNSRYLGIGNAQYCINNVPENRKNSANFNATKEPRRSFDFLQRHLWVYWLASHGDGKAIIPITEYYQNATILTKFEKEYEGRPCLCFLIKDRARMEIEFAFSKQDDFAPCRVEHKGELKSIYNVKAWEILQNRIRLPKEVVLHRAMPGASVDTQVSFRSIQINPTFPADLLRIKYPPNCALYNSFDNTCNIVNEAGEILRPCTTPGGVPIKYLGAGTTEEVLPKNSSMWQYYIFSLLLISIVIVVLLRWRQRSRTL